MPLTKTQICNMALGHLGVSATMTDVDADASATSLAFLLYYDNARDDLLRAYPWAFAKKYAALAGKAAAPNDEWGFSYTYPADCLFLRKILDGTRRHDASLSNIPFARGDGLVFTNVDNAKAEYTVQVTDVLKFTPDFTRLLSLLLAAQVGPRLSDGNARALAKDAYAQYEKELAATVDTEARESKHWPEEAVSTGKEDIVNAAFAHLGLTFEMQSLTSEKSVYARTARQFYDRARDETLRAIHWPFATKIAALAGKVATPNTDWAYSYTFPADAVDVRKILDPAQRVHARDSRIPFKRATGGLIYTNLNDATCEYTMKEDTPAQYPADFYACFTLKLAELMAPRLVPKAELTATLKEIKERWNLAIQEAVKNMLKEQNDAPDEVVAATEPKENICNTALVHLGLGELEVQDLETERSVHGRVFRQVFDDTRDMVLRDFSWPVATKTATLTLVANDPTTEWGYSYRLPSDCLMPRRILSGSRNDTAQSRVPYRLAHDATGILIYTDTEDAVLEYTARLDDATKYYMPDFEAAFALALAHAVAPTLLKSMKDKHMTMQNIAMKYNYAVLKAQSNAANEEVPDQIPDSEFERARL